MRGETVHDPYVLRDPRHIPRLLVLLMMTIEGVALAMFLVIFMMLTVVAFTMFLVMRAVMTFAMFLMMLAVVALVVFLGLPRERMTQTIKHTHRYPPWQDAAGEPFTTSFGRVKRPVVTRAANLPTRPS